MAAGLPGAEARHEEIVGIDDSRVVVSTWIVLPCSASVKRCRAANVEHQSGGKSTGPLGCCCPVRHNPTSSARALLDNCSPADPTTGGWVHSRANHSPGGPMRSRPDSPTCPSPTTDHSLAQVFGGGFPSLMLLTPSPGSFLSSSVLLTPALITLLYLPPFYPRPGCFLSRCILSSHLSVVLTHPASLRTSVSRHVLLSIDRSARRPLPALPPPP